MAGSWCGFGFGSHHSSKRWGSEWGGSVPTPYMTAGGAVGSKGLSPEAAVWKTSGVTAGPHIPENGVCFGSVNIKGGWKMALS